MTKDYSLQERCEFESVMVVHAERGREFESTEKIPLVAEFLLCGNGLALQLGRFLSTANLFIDWLAWCWSSQGGGERGRKVCVQTQPCICVFNVFLQTRVQYDFPIPSLGFISPAKIILSSRLAAVRACLQSLLMSSYLQPRCTRSNY